MGGSVGREAEDASPERVLTLVDRATHVARSKTRSIQSITQQTQVLALNATLEAARAGQAGLGFAVVAREVKSVAQEVGRLAREMDSELAAALGDLRAVGERMTRDLRGQRLVDLALNAIEIIDRNLYERSCDVRWWATDAAVVEAAAAPTPAACAQAERRLGVILSAYTVYLDLWLADAGGRVIAHGRPDRYPQVRGVSVAGEPWFRSALESASGDDFAVADIARCPALGNAPVATYAAAVREGGETRGRVLGVLGIHFDWEPQAAAVVRGVRLTRAEAERTRALIVDRAGRVLAASDGRGELEEAVALPADAGEAGFRERQGSLIAFHRTRGYETYRGLGWAGVIVQEPASARSHASASDAQGSLTAV